MALQIQESSLVSVFGPVASGKTYIMKKLMSPYRRLIWFDTTFEIDFSDADYEHVLSPWQLIERLHKGKSDYRIAYHPTMKDMVAEFDGIARVYWQEDFPRWLAIDEVHEYSNSAALDSIARYSRKRFLGVICASQRIADVPKIVTSGSRSVILFFTHEARDHIAIKDRFGDEVLSKTLGLRPLIFNDVSKQVKQYPQCVVYKRGEPIEIHDLEQSAL